MSTEHGSPPTTTRRINPFSAVVADALPLLIGYVDREERYRFVNLAYEQWFDLKRGDIEGRTLSEVLDEETYARVAPNARRALAGETLRYDSVLSFRQAEAREIEAFYVPDVGTDGAVAGFYFVVTDISDRRALERTRHRELALEQRRAFVLELETKLRNLADPGEVLRTAATALGERLAARRVGYAEVDESGQFGEVLAEWVADGSTGFAGRRYRLDDFGPELWKIMRAGQEVSVTDVQTLESSDRAAHWAIGNVAYIAVPLVKAGQLLAYLYVSCDAPRPWSQDEVELTRQVTERTWTATERARSESALRMAEETERLLIREVDHRAKNVLAVVQSLVRLTPFTSKEQYMRDLNGRIDALARAHSLLSSNRWGGVQLDILLREELEAYLAGASVKLEGPPVIIRAPAAQPLGLVLHELATNAAKHGALAHPQGRVEITWRCEAPEACEIVWRETGSKVDPRAGRGFGSRLIAAAVEQLNGKSQRELGPDGLVFRMSLGPNAVIGVAAREETSRPSAPIEARLANRRVLVVEDEALVAMDLQATVEEAGCIVVGPVGNVEDALKLADEPLDCAILDVNLGGRSIQPVARVLADRGVPHIYITGYQDPFQTANLVLRKPAAPAAVVGALRAALAGPQPTSLA